jgi:hypothetical protein
LRRIPEREDLGAVSGSPGPIFPYGLIRLARGDPTVFFPNGKMTLILPNAACACATRAPAAITAVRAQVAAEFWDDEHLDRIVDMSLRRAARLEALAGKRGP